MMMTAETLSDQWLELFLYQDSTSPIPEAVHRQTYRIMKQLKS